MRGTLRDATLSNHRSRLSVRWIVGGQYTYEVDGVRFVLEPGKFLILNDGLLQFRYTAARPLNALLFLFIRRFVGRTDALRIRKKAARIPWHTRQRLVF